ncbi:MAG: RNA methyltransferase [Saprospiraceae bacterium]|nr:RNA methyltransferase [Saprospiraceae bacterium]
MIKSISSPVNPLIKQIVLLGEKTKVRKESGTFIVEGKREILLAIKSGLKVLTVLFNPSIITYNKLHDWFGNILFEVEMIEVTNQVYHKIAYREGTEGVIAIFQSRHYVLSELKFEKKNPLILVAEATEKPGNIGALMRTSDAAGIDAFIISNPNTDIYNPNIIRASVGCVFTNRIVSGTTTEIITFLKSEHIKIFCATLTDGATSLYDHNFTGPTAIVVGTESTGVSQEWIEAADYNIIIPMKGLTDSLNVSVSAAILIYEAVRQRDLIPKSDV